MGFLVMLIAFSQVSFSYGASLIFSDASFTISEGERVCLVGENGAGKTTLIKLMIGEAEAEAGSIAKKSGLKVGYLAQNGGYDSANTVLGEMRLVFKRELEAVEKLSALSARLAEAEYGGKEYLSLSSSIEALNKFIASRDCYNVEVKIKTVLNGLGLEKFYERRIAEMSGGEKTRLKLARLLLEEPELLILDEPTNHLDVKTLFWLEDYIATFKGAVFVVSHDRYFLDRVARRTLELENKKLFEYSGAYTVYKRLKADRVALELKEYEKKCEELKKLQTYVDKNIVRATTAKSAQSRVKQIERLGEAEKPYSPPAPPRFGFTYEREPEKEVLRVHDLNLEIGGKSLICGGQFSVLRGERVAIIGDNGVGKSTLLRAIVNAENRAIALGRYVKLAYYDQEMANLNPQNTVLEELWERHIAATQTEVRASLARCGLYPEDMDKQVSSLSGGERAKLALCVFENEKGNVLILDEPTNHLDLPARESLEEALRTFQGTVIFVSHDRYFISQVAQSVLEIEDKRITRYEGGYEGYKRQKELAAAALRKEESEREYREYKESRERSFRSARDRSQEAKLKAEMKSIEADISRYEEEEGRLSAELSDPAVAANYTEVSARLQRIEKIHKELERLYARYGELLG